MVGFSCVNELYRDKYPIDFSRSAYISGMMLKTIFLKFVYDVSDRRIEEEAYFNPVFNWYTVLAIDDSPPMPPVSHTFVTI